eukprot:TRINITY_DN4954_c0_g2_i1.p1 TRINITY_DN4954_c0_g2~~TRINITY_DN4954_c0_g2_i1.p1  ORF type:complete len:1204 (-),score=253.03 TRINITY_DN4954_c0_g2_i1:310-3393(-)
MESIAANETDPKLTTTLDISLNSHMLDASQENVEQSLRKWGFHLSVDGTTRSSVTIFVQLRQSEKIKESLAAVAQPVKSKISHPQGSMRLFVNHKVAGEKQHEIFVNPTDTVQILKERIEEATGISAATMYVTDRRLTSYADLNKKISEFDLHLDDTITARQKFQERSHHRFEATNSWQPVQRPQTASGMSCFLSCLYVLSSKRVDRPTSTWFSRELLKLIGYPPAAVAFRYLSQGVDISESYKAALSSSLFRLFRSLIDLNAVPDNKIFEKSATCFGLIFSLKSAAGDSQNSAADPFMCTNTTCSLTFVPLVDPVSVGTRRDYYNRSAVTELIKRSTNPEEDFTVTEQPFVKSLLLVSQGDLAGQLYILKEEIPQSVDELKKLVTAASSARFDAVERNTRKFIATSFKCLRVISALSLKVAEYPCLTYDTNLHVVVCLGTQGCSAALSVFVPLKTSQGFTDESIDPDILAKKLEAISEASGVSLLEDDREVKEAIMVILDTSNSMSNTSWSTSDAENSDDEEEKIELTPHQIDAEVAEFKKGRYLNLLKKVVAKYGVQEVLFGLRRESSIFAALLDYPSAQDKIIQILEEPIEEKVKAPPSCQIFVKLLEGQTITIDVDLSWTVEDLRQAIEEKVTEKKKRYHLLYAGRYLEEHKTLQDSGITEQCTVFQQFGLSLVSVAFLDQPIEKRAIALKCMNPTKYRHVSCFVSVFNTDTIRAVKLKIWEASGICPAVCALWKDMKPSGDGFMSGTSLIDDKKLNTYLKADQKELEVDMYSANSDKSKKLSRIDIVRQLFHAFINRSQAYNYPTQIGLTLFSTNVREVCKITPLFEVFRDHIEKMYTSGDTCLYDAAAQAALALEEFGNKHKGCVLRIICLSDGEDTKSTVSALSVAQTLQKKGIILDAVMIGEGANNEKLKAIAKASGGYAFAPSTLKNALKLNELETLLFTSERPASKNKGTSIMDNNALMKFAKVPLDICNDDVVPARKDPDLLHEPVQSLKKTLEKASTLETSADSSDLSREPSFPS